MTIRTSVLLACVGIFAVWGAALSADEMTLTGTVARWVTRGAASNTRSATRWPAP